MVMKRKVLCLALAALMVLGLLSGCGGSGAGGGQGSADKGDAPGASGEANDGGKVLNIYVWNQEFQEKFNANYPEVEKLSNDKSITYLKDGTRTAFTSRSWTRLCPSRHPPPPMRRSICSWWRPTMP